ncbi:MAG: ribbon-helix-helix domain-containing protein [Planctomycetota bacterium]
MPKTKTSISLDEKLVTTLDEHAKTEGMSRSQLIERFIEAGLEDQGEPMYEFFKMTCMPSEVVKFMSIGEPNDDDGPIEVVKRVSVTRWQAWQAQRDHEQATQQTAKGSKK